MQITDCKCLISCACMCSFSERGSHEWESMVASNRDSFTEEFFKHVEMLIRAAHEEPKKQEGVLSENLIASRLVNIGR